ncbi:5-formyltetrahydrofolate cyclo-ligase [Tepidamorphus sp. 3E244]|uniref:5-formyltetrahydrofolate cyclo-ligase n=1 Tax=Tepidamorphus sp. 3E244 TaxID=3385498 RepID=UPI0038FC86C5
MTSEDDQPGSAPCFAHELEQSADGSFHIVDPQQRADVMRWRKGERKRLLDQRLEGTAEHRRELAGRIAENLEAEFGDVSGKTISFYWPLKGEPDLRPLMAHVIASGGACALPVVVERNTPLHFHSWAPGESLEKGFWNIPVPRDVHEVQPDIVLAPVVGFDAGCFRLGYGGGYFDRTLASLTERPRVVGVGYAAARIETIYPLPHDIALDVVVTENGINRPAKSD